MAFLFSHKLLSVSLLHALCFLSRNLAIIILPAFQTENVFAVPFRIRSETMGGRAIRSEPQQLTISAAAQEILERAGWLNYFNHLQESNETVVMEFLQNLQDDHSTVRGKRIAVNDAIIAEVSGLPATGPVWTLKKERL